MSTPSYAADLERLRAAELNSLLGGGWKPRAELLTPAQKRWAALRSLSNNAEERELLEAGVPQRRIAILYEPAFEDLVERLIETIRPEHYRHLNGEQEWETREAGARYLYNEVRGVGSASALTDAQNGRSLWSLRDHILRCLPEDGNRGARANAMATSLWCVHWLMVNAEADEGPEEELHYQFIAVCDWVVPSLAKAG